MNTTRTYKSIEARSATALHLKVLASKTTGWVVDGPALQVTDYSHRKRAVLRYSQGMFKQEHAPLHWEFAH